MRRVLVANRGEIAIRIIRACHEFGVEAVAVYSIADKESLHVRLADRAICIGNAAPGQSYLNIPAILAAAKGSGSDAVHPGYGFLSENAEFAQACVEEGFIYIGPKPATIATMGDKVRARERAREAGVPVISGLEVANLDLDPNRVDRKLGYPVLIKAAAGGGGRGMRQVMEPAGLSNALREAQAEAKAAFGNPTVYLETYLVNARHVEVQILGDGRRAIHLGERDCSLQRRHQKLVEESPCPVIDERLRKELCGAAVRLSTEIEYASAGTVEFLLDANTGQYFFIEMNTRIQVEHPVTEAVTGIDLVMEQLRIAAGENLNIEQNDVAIDGHAIECRITAEDPLAGFAPGPGRLERHVPPGGLGIRVDTHCYQGYVVPAMYDSLLAKVIAHGNNREEARKRIAVALQEYWIEGIPTTLAFQRRMLEREAFIEGTYNTDWVERVYLPSVLMGVDTACA